MSTVAKTLDNTAQSEIDEAPLISGNQTFSSVTEKISEIAEAKTPKLWYVALAISSSMLLLMLVMILYLIWEGIGIWGVNVPVGWGWAIVNFVLPVLSSA